MIGTNALTDVGRFLDVDGVRTFFVEQGDGEAVVMLHGAGPGVCAQVSWQQNLDPLARAGFWTIAYDQPGFGRSGVPADHSLERRIHHARAFIDALGLTHYHLIGSSAGAYVAAQLALEDPRVDRLVLVAGSGLLSGVTDAPSTRPQEPDPTVESIRALTEETLVRRDLATEDLVQLRFEMSSGLHHQAHLARLAAPQRRSLADRLPTLRPKTLILWGKQDHLSGPDQALQMFSLIPGAELHLFDGCGHWVQWDQAQRFNQVVVDFLKAVD